MRLSSTTPIGWRAIVMGAFITTHKSVALSGRFSSARDFW
jgi:hypothetical protein